MSAPVLLCILQQTHAFISLYELLLLTMPAGITNRAKANHMYIFKRAANYVLLPVIIATIITGCAKKELKINTTSDANITGYLLQKPDSYALLSELLELSGTAAYLNAYGNYTLFAPTNTAIQQYLQQAGKKSLQELDTATLKNIIRFHLLEDTLYTGTFTDGRLRVQNMYGQYLVTGAAFENGQTSYTIHKQANILSANIKTANGIIHVIDKVLTPPTNTLAKQIQQDAGYSIFTAALQQTGWYDSLNRPLDKAFPAWFTVLAVPDTAFNRIGIQTFQQLKNKYSSTGNTTEKHDSLNIYVAYHILKDIKFSGDLLKAYSHPTCALPEVITTSLRAGNLVINEVTINNITEPGVVLDRNSSDISATNGVLHRLHGNYELKVRVPEPVYWDVADQPELRRLSALFRKPGNVQEFASGYFNDIRWTGGTIKYNTEATSTSNVFYYDDYLSLYLRPAVTSSIEFTTPFILKGRYKVWICVRRTRKQRVSTYFDSTQLQRVFDWGDYYPVDLSETDAELSGYKRYMNSTNTSHVGRLAGIIDVATSGRHIIKFVPLTDEAGTANTFSLDMIHFIPVDKPQTWPRFNRDGSLRLTP